MEIKNGSIVRGTIGKDEKEKGKKIISKVNTNVFNILNGKMIYDFKIKMLAKTIHLLYQNNPLKSLRKVEYRTDIDIKEFKNYSCSVDASDSTIYEISKKIADEIYDELNGMYCYTWSMLTNKQRDEIASQREAFQTLCNSRLDIISNLGRPECDYAIYYKVASNTQLFVGNGAIRTAINDNDIIVDGSEVYVDVCNFILQNRDVVNESLQKVIDFGNEMNGRFGLDKNRKLNFYLYGFTETLGNRKTIREIIENGLNMDDELNDIRTWVNEVKMEKKREEEKCRKEIVKLKAEILNQPLSRDIYTFIQQSPSQTKDVIVISLMEKGICDEESEIEILIEKMTKAHLLVTTEIKSYPNRDKTIVMYNVDRSYPDSEVA